MTSTSLPGFDFPAAGFDQPFEMLEVCHERMRRSVSLLHRLVAHIDTHGHDHHSRSAARDVLRYFDVAAPQHHKDEELHVFPTVLESGNASQAAVVKALLEDHERMGEIWSHLRVALSQWADPATSAPVDQETRQLIEEFSALNERHLEREESVAFPSARALATPGSLASMSAEMQARRRV